MERVVMESLALLVAIMMLIALLGGPIAIGITRIKTENIFLTVVRRIFHGIFVAMSLWVGIIFFFSNELPLTPRLIGLFALVMSYFATRREYFPDVRIIAPLLAKFGIKLGKNRGNNEPDSSRHGPMMKWRRSGNSGGDDGHGPEGQH